jgi:hypothetical protein
METRYLPLLLALLLGGCSGDDAPRERQGGMSEQNPFRPLVDSHDRAGTVETQVLDQAAAKRRAIEAQER